MSARLDHVEWLEGAGGGAMLVVDHASNAIPPGAALGIDAALLDTHIAIDLGAGAVARRLNAEQRFPAALARWTRLWVDLNRFRDEPGVIAGESDGIPIPANQITDDAREARLVDYYDAYHAEIAALIERTAPTLLVFLHSFTPALSTRPDERRPWHLGMMYDEDVRAARIATGALAAAGFDVGDQLPYSGKIYASSLRRHGEANGIPYFGLEMRQDLLASEEQQADMAARLGPVFAALAESLA